MEGKNSLGELDSESCLVLDNWRVFFFSLARTYYLGGGGLGLKVAAEAVLFSCFSQSCSLACLRNDLTVHTLAGNCTVNYLL